MSGQPAGLLCPECGEHASLIISGNQAFCGNDDCRIFMWDPAKSIEELMSDIHFIDLRRLEP